MTSRHFLCSLLICCFCHAEMFGENIISLNANQDIYDLWGNKIEVFEDRTAQLTFEQIQRQTFISIIPQNIKAGYTKSKFWYRFKVKNNSEKEWILVILGTLLDEIELYQIQEDTHILRKRVTGDFYPHHYREIDSPIFGFHAAIPPQKTHTLYLSVKSHDPIEFSLHMEEYKHFEYVLRRNMFKWFFYFGMIFMMFVYHLLLFFSTRDTTYLYYILYIANFGLFQFAIFGYGTQFIWNDSVWVANHTTNFFAGGSTISIALFSYKFLNIRYFYPALRVVYFYVVICGLFITLADLIYPSASLNQLIALISIFNTLLMVLIGVLVLRKGYPPARYYMIAWGILFFSIAIFTLNVAKVIPDNNISYLILPFGAVVELILLSFGLGNRIKTIEHEKNEAQVEVIKQMQENESVKVRIARDLHDDLGSTLSSIRILSEFAHLETVNHPEKVPSLLDKIKNSTQKLQENLQDIVWTTQSKDNSSEELLARMRLFGGEILEAKNIQYHFKNADALGKIRLSPNIQYDIFMIFKEAIHNITKYAQAQNVEVSFTLENQFLILNIRDDGVGFDTSQKKNGNGLKNMPRRAENIGGTMEIISKKGAGTNISLTVPVPI